MLKRFFSFFFGSMIFFTLILQLVDLLMNIWGYMANEAPVFLVGKIFLYYMPKTLWYSVPMAVLFATVYTLSDFYAKNELLAVFASGVSLFRFTLPVMVISALMSVGMFFLDDRLVAKTYSQKKTLQQQALHKEKSLDSDNVVVMSEGGKIIYKADFYDNKQQKLNSLYVLYRNDDRSFDGLLFAQSAEWRYDHWVPSSSVFYKKEGGRFTAADVDYDHLFRLTESPESFKSNLISVEEVPAAEARSYIARLEKAGLPSTEAKAAYYKKYSFPFVVLVVVMLAIALSGKTRKNVLLISLGLSIASVVVFYVMQMITMLMAGFGTIPPIFGGWFPVVFFIFLSAILLRYTRT